MGTYNSRVLENLPYNTYYWSVQAIDNAFAGSAFAVKDTFVVKIDDTFIKGIYNDISYSIFPNPVQSILNIEISEKNIQKVEVTIYNAIGKIVIYNSFDERNFSVDTKSLIKGLYYLKIEFDNNSICKKIIKI